MIVSPIEIADVRFNLLRNAIYHTARRAFLDRCNKVFNFLVIFLGASAIGQFGATFHITDQELIALGTTIATLQLSFDFGVRARNHEYLQRRFYELLAETERVAEPDQAKLAEWNSLMFLLYAEEPPPMRALDAVAYNAACDAIGKSHAHRKITIMQSFLRHFYPFNGTDFVLKKEIAPP